MAWPHDMLFVVYCAGPHCNGADKAALRLAKLGRPVKVMIGGVTGWADEGFPFEIEPGPRREAASAESAKCRRAGTSGQRWHVTLGPPAMLSADFRRANAMETFP